MNKDMKNTYAVLDPALRWSYMVLFQFSPIRMPKTVTIAFKNVLKFERGYQPVLVSGTSMGLRGQSLFRPLNLIRQANISIPRSEQMNMNISIKTEKWVMSLRVVIMVYSNFLNAVQDLASLKTLSNRRALRDVRAPPVDYTPSKPTTSSMIEKHTIVQSNMLKLSLAYSLNPRPSSFINSSVKNIRDNVLLQNSSYALSAFFIGYLSYAKIKVLSRVQTVMINANAEWVQIKKEIL